MIIASILLLVLLVWAFDLVRNMAKWVLPPAIAVVLAVWFNYTVRLDSFEKAFYSLLMALKVPSDVFVGSLPYLVLYCLILTFLHCFRRK